MKAWTQTHLTWVKTVHFEHAAQEATLLDYLHEVEHVADRIERLERAIDDAVKTAPERMRAVIEALQALRGIAQVSAVTIVAEVGELSRFAKPRQLMGYSGAVASEDSSGERMRRGGDHQDRQRAPPAGRHRSGVGVSVSTRRGRRASQAPGARQCRGESDRVEGAASIARALPALDRAGQMQTANGDRGRPRAVRVHLGHRGATWNPTDVRGTHARRDTSRQ